MLFVKKSYLKIVLLLTGLLIVCASSLVNAQSLQFTSKRNREMISFKLIKNLMIIPIYINGKGPFNFVLDTGVGIFVITDPKLIDSLEIKNLRSIKITGFGQGDDLSAYVTSSVKVNIGNDIEGNIPAAILKKDAFDLSGFVGMPIQGLIGYEFFNSFIVRINYSVNTIIVYKTETAYIPRKGTKMPISIEDHKPYISVDILLGNGEKTTAKLIIDTGAGHPVSLETDNGFPFTVPETNIGANLGVGLSGPINGYLGRIPSIRIGKYELKNVIAAFPDYHDAAAKVTALNRNGNLGNNVLKHFDLVLDYSREALYVKPSVLFKEPFEHDMSGMELVSGGEEYKRIFISRVENGSAADDTGLKKEDEIVSINFKPVKDMSLEEIDTILRSRNDRSIILEILSPDTKQSQRVILTLKRRI